MTGCFASEIEKLWNIMILSQILEKRTLIGQPENYKDICDWRVGMTRACLPMVSG
jgi:hypothetical protein